MGLELVGALLSVMRLAQEKARLLQEEKGAQEVVVQDNCVGTSLFLGLPPLRWRV